MNSSRVRELTSGRGTLPVAEISLGVCTRRTGMQGQPAQTCNRWDQLLVVAEIIGAERRMETGDHQIWVQPAGRRAEEEVAAVHLTDR